MQLRDLDDDALRKLSREAHLFLSLDEMKTIQSHFRDAGREDHLHLERFSVNLAGGHARGLTNIPWHSTR